MEACIASANGNFPTVSSTEIREASKVFRTEASQYIISKGYNVYWLAFDLMGLKRRAEDVKSAIEGNNGPDNIVMKPE